MTHGYFLDPNGTISSMISRRACDRQQPRREKGEEATTERSEDANKRQASAVHTACTNVKSFRVETGAAFRTTCRLYKADEYLTIQKKHLRSKRTGGYDPTGWFLDSSSTSRTLKIRTILLVVV